MCVRNKENHSSSEKALAAWYPEILVFLLAFCFFGLLLVTDVETDIQTHAHYVGDFVTGRVPPPANFLYYLLVYLLSLGQINAWQWLYFASAAVLGLSVANKFAITRYLLTGMLRAEAPLTLLHGRRHSADLLALLFVSGMIYVTSIFVRGTYF